ERAPWRVRRVFRLLHALLELPVEHLALLPLGLHLLPEPLLALGGLLAQLVERGAEIIGRALRRRHLVRDHGRKLRVDRQLRLTAGTRHDEGVLLIHRVPTLSAASGRVKPPTSRAS